MKLPITTIFCLFSAIQTVKYIDEDLVINGNYCVSETHIIRNDVAVELTESANITISSNVVNVFINRGILSLSGTINILGTKKRQIILVDGSYVNFDVIEKIIGPKECNINMWYNYKNNRYLIDLCYPKLDSSAIVLIVVACIVIIGIILLIISVGIIIKRRSKTHTIIDSNNTL